MAAENPPEPALVAKVQAYLDREDVRQATDIVQAEPVQVVQVVIDVKLEHLAGPDPAVLKSRAQAAINKVIAARRAPGRDLPRSAIIGAAAVEGIERVVLSAPASDVIAGPSGLIEVAYVTITSELVDG
jgi:phage-related baseplate assembly protein